MAETNPRIEANPGCAGCVPGEAACERMKWRREHEKATRDNIKEGRAKFADISGRISLIATSAAAEQKVNFTALLTDLGIPYTDEDIDKPFEGLDQNPALLARIDKVNQQTAELDRIESRLAAQVLRTDGVERDLLGCPGLTETGQCPTFHEDRLPI